MKRNIFFTYSVAIAACFGNTSSHRGHLLLAVILDRVTWLAYLLLCTDLHLLPASHVYFLRGSRENSLEPQNNINLENKRYLLHNLLLSSSYTYFFFFSYTFLLKDVPFLVCFSLFTLLEEYCIFKKANSLEEKVG